MACRASSSATRDSGPKTRLLDQLQPILAQSSRRAGGAGRVACRNCEDAVCPRHRAGPARWPGGHRSSGKRAPRRSLPMLSRLQCAQRDQMQAAARGLEDAVQGSMGRVARRVRSRRRAISSSRAAVPLCRPPGWRGRELWRSLQLAGCLERVQTRQRQGQGLVGERPYAPGGAYGPRGARWWTI